MKIKGLRQSDLIPLEGQAGPYLVELVVAYALPRMHGKGTSSLSFTLSLVLSLTRSQTLSRFLSFPLSVSLSLKRSGAADVVGQWLQWATAGEVQLLC